MSDPLGLMNSIGGQGPEQIGRRPDASKQGDQARQSGQGPSFRDVLMRNIEQVNELQQDATRAIEQLQTGERGDVEGVILATQKADLAFRALQSVRNRMMEAVEEVKQMRV